MMMRNLKLNAGTALSTLLVTCFTAQAQKLPGVQQAGLRAPAQIKIDGKTTEWNNQLQAYNKATGIYYTLSNDDGNLYLTIQAKDRLVIRKILSGGIVFTANRSVKKVDEHVSVTFPLMAVNISSEIGNYLTQRASITSDKPGNIYQRDSLLLLMNTTLINSLKEIKIKGVKQLTDTTLSVYNEAGIKARALFDTHDALTCELAIPIKYLELLPAAATAGFSYQVKVNNIGANINFKTAAPVMVRTIPLRTPGAMQSRMQADQQILTTTTDFWGVYTLAGR